MASQLSVSEVNSLQGIEFESVFGNVIELCEDAARRVKVLRPFKSKEEISKAFCKYLDDINIEEKLTILKQHPDLAGRLDSQGKLTKESTEEQRSAGLHEITIAEKQLIDIHNQRYKEKFGFPFIICARENKVHSIITGLQTRYNNNQKQEIDTGIEEVKKICTLRVRDIIKDD